MLRRLPESPPGAGPPPWRLSPVREGGSARAPPLCLSSATPPPALYRTAFAEECEAIALQLQLGRAARRASTIEGEKLTPLEPSWSFLDASQTPARGLSLPPPAAASGEAGLGAGGKPDAPPPPPGPSSGDGPRLSSPGNLTYEIPAAAAASTFLCEGPSADEDGEAASAARRTYELELPGEASARSFVTSTPLLRPAAPPWASPPPPPPAEAGSASRPKPRIPSPAPRRTGPAPKSGGRPGRLAQKGPTAASAAPEAALRKPPKRSLAGPGGGGGSAAAQESRPLAQQQVPDKTKKCLSNKKPPMSIRPPSKVFIGPQAEGSLPCLGLERHGVCRGLKAPATKLPVPAAAVSNKKRSCPSKSPAEKPTYGVLLDVGQGPSAALQSGPVAPCSQCQQLAKENERLKCMLEDYQRIVAALKEKMMICPN